MTQLETLPALPARSIPHKSLTIAAAALTAILVVPSALSGDLLDAIFTFMLVPILCLVRAYRIRAGRRWLIGAVLLALAMLAASVHSVLGGSDYAWLGLVVLVKDVVYIVWGEGERRFGSEKRWAAATAIAVEHGTATWFVAHASPAGEQTRVVLHSPGRDPWNTAVWGTVQPGMLLVLTSTREILYAAWA